MALTVTQTYQTDAPQALRDRRAKDLLEPILHRILSDSGKYATAIRWHSPGDDGQSAPADTQKKAT